MPDYDDDSHFFDSNVYNVGAIGYCPDSEPLVSFSDHQWWINYHWTQETGTYQYEPFKSDFDPKVIEVSDDGIRLQILPGKNPDVWRTSEIVLMEKLGYGDYLITARADDGSFSDLDKHAVFGAFIYQYSEAPPSNGKNIHREIDFLEVLRGDNGNAQFTLQPYDPAPHPVSFFKIPRNTQIITIINRWCVNPGSTPQSKFYCYSGEWSFENPAPQDALIAEWSPADIPEASKLIPDHTDSSCERLHLNLWLMHGKAPSKPQSVTITRFQFKPE